MTDTTVKPTWPVSLPAYCADSTVVTLIGYWKFLEIVQKATTSEIGMTIFSCWRKRKACEAKEPKGSYRKAMRGCINRVRESRQRKVASMCSGCLACNETDTDEGL